jgi:hypothetical protein
MSSFFSSNSTTDTNIIEEKKAENATTESSTPSSDDLKKISSVSLKAFGTIMYIIFFSAIFYYYCVGAYAGVLPTSLPFADPINGEYFNDIKLNHDTVPIYTFGKKCNNLFYSADDVNKYFKETSYLYSLNNYKPTEYEDIGAGFIKYSLINFIQRVIILNYNVVSTYFEFLNSFCSESVSLMIGFLLIIPFFFIFIFCHIVFSIGCWAWSIYDFFKIPAFPTNLDKLKMEAKENEGFLTTLSNIFTTSAEKAAEAKKDIDMKWSGILLRLFVAFWYLILGSMVVVPLSIFSGVYSLLTPLLIHSKIGSDDGEPFSFLTMVQNNIKFYSRGYLIYFSLLLISDAFTEANSNTAIGCLLAIIILVIANKLFNAYIPSDAENPFSGEQCLKQESTKIFNRSNNNSITSPKITEIKQNDQDILNVRPIETPTIETPIKSEIISEESVPNTLNTENIGEIPTIAKPINEQNPALVGGNKTPKMKKNKSIKNKNHHKPK